MSEEQVSFSDDFVQYFHFEGGPLDGCSLTVPGDRFICDLFVGVPSQMKGDKENRITGEAVHHYTNCNTIELEGSKQADHHMGHVAVRIFALSVVHKFFMKGKTITPENQLWIDEVNAAIARAEEKQQLGFDADNDDETDEERYEDGEGWNNA